MYNGYKRSPCLNGLKNNISKLNNYLCYYLFIAEQFQVVAKEIVDVNPREFLSDLFKDNRYCNSLNIKAGELNAEGNKYRNAFLSNLFVNLYSCIDYYQEEMYELIKDLYPKNKKESKQQKILGIIDSRKTLEEIHRLLEKVFEEKDESRLQKMLYMVSGPNSKEADVFGEEYIITLKYLRLRRNRIIHDDGSVAQSISSLIRYSGEGIAKFWKSKLPRNYINFSESNLDVFTVDEIIGGFNIARSICEQIDEKLINQIEEVHLINHALKCYDKSIERRQNKYSKEIFFRKFSKYILNLYGIELNCSNIDEVYNKHMGM